MSDTEENTFNDEESTPEATEEEVQRHRIRDNLSTLSFEELMKLKEKLGSKVYNETVFGSKNKKKTPLNDLVKKRENKNRPREVSSKIRLKQLRHILSSQPQSKHQTQGPRDPRFDPSCGEFDKSTFKQNYQFVNELREKEKEELQKEYRECTDATRKKTIKLLIQRIDNQTREEEKISKIKQKDEEEKIEIRNKLKQGEKPVYKKKSVKKLESLVEKYEELKKTNSLQKHIQRKAKKLKGKDRRVMDKIK